MESRKIIPVSRPDLSELEKNNLITAFDSSWISSSGKFVDDFENSWANEAGSEYALSVANGTVALHLILIALEIGPGDEVIVPSLTFIATANVVRYVGATPIFADCDQEDWNISVDEVRRLSNNNTKAIICVHLYGVPCNVQELDVFCKSKNIYLIEDAAEAPFAEAGGKRIGSFGIASSFSFYGNKVITSGEGGAVATSDPDLYRSMKLIRGQGMDPVRRYYFPKIGYNFRLTNMQCAILCAQLERAPYLLHKRQEIFEYYEERLSLNSSISWQNKNPENLNTPWLFTCLIEVDSLQVRDKVIEELMNSGIETRPIFIPIHLLPPYRTSNEVTLQNTEKISAKGISLPTYSTLTREDQEYVCNSFLKILSKFGIE